MRACRPAPALAALLLVTTLATAFIGPARGQAGQDDDAGRLVVLLIIDTNAQGLGQGPEANGALLGEILGEVDDAFQKDPAIKRLGIRVLTKTIDGDGVTPRGILDAVRALDVRPTDSFLVYYAGHGGVDRTHGHFLSTSGGDLVRSALRREVVEKRARMAALVTDSCSSMGTADVREMPARRKPAKWRLFYNLFFQHRGLVDIQAATPPEFAWYNTVRGGFFTNVLGKLFCEPLPALDADRDKFVSWDEFYGRVRDDTNRFFREAREQAAPGSEIRESSSQLPWRLPEGEAEPSLRVYEKYLRVSNETGEPIVVSLRYNSYGPYGWEWRGDLEPIRFEVAPGRTLDLTDDGAPILASRVKIWAEGRRSGRTWADYRDSDLRIAPQEGYRRTKAPESFTHTFR